MAIVFGERFADGLYTGDARVQLIVDATDPNMSTSQSNYAASIVSSAGQEMLPPNVSVSRLTPDVKLLYNPQMKSAYNFCARSHGADFNVDLRDDDLYFHSS